MKYIELKGTGHFVLRLMHVTLLHETNVDSEQPNCNAE